MVGLMSGIFSLFREVVLINHPEKAKDHHLFWRCIFITFILSSMWLWISEHQQVLEQRARLEALTIPNLDCYIARIITTDVIPENSKNAFILVSGISLIVAGLLCWTLGE